jgi:hypothetical protein
MFLLKSKKDFPSKTPSSPEEVEVLVQQILKSRPVCITKSTSADSAQFLQFKQGRRQTKKGYITIDEVFDVIVKEHTVNSNHPGRDKTFYSIKGQYHGIKREEVIYLLKQCRTCNLDKPKTSRAPLKPIKPNMSGKMLRAVEERGMTGLDAEKAVNDQRWSALERERGEAAKERGAGGVAPPVYR